MRQTPKDETTVNSSLSQSASFLRRRHNRDVLRRMHRGDPLQNMDPGSTWFPPRPSIKKDWEAISRLYLQDLPRGS